MSLSRYWFFFAAADDREVGLVVNGHRATKAVNTKMLDEGARQWVAVVEQQSFEIARILERTPIGHHAGVGLIKGSSPTPAATFSLVRHRPMAS